jgi:hypothetical protein
LGNFKPVAMHLQPHPNLDLGTWKATRAENQKATAFAGTERRGA